MDYKGNLVDYYDKIFSKKKYKQEIDYILNCCEKYHVGAINDILDFGCGTGTHALLMEKETNANLFGYDPSPEMIEVANTKISRCIFTNELSNITETFDLFVSMFYVVNHMTKLSELKNFFNIASNLIQENGLLIFDCWNGIAAIRDPPFSAERERYRDDNLSITTACLSHSSLLDSNVFMKNVVKIIQNEEVIEKFSYKLQHTIWTPYLLKELLEEYKFEILSINKTYDIDKEAQENDYKIVFVCRRRKEI